MKSNPIGFEYVSLDVESYAWGLRRCIVTIHYTPLQRGGKEMDMEN